MLLGQSSTRTANGVIRDLFCRRRHAVRRAGMKCRSNASNAARLLPKPRKPAAIRLLWPIACSGCSLCAGAIAFEKVAPGRVRSQDVENLVWDAPIVRPRNRTRLVGKQRRDQCQYRSLRSKHAIQSSSGSLSHEAASMGILLMGTEPSPAGLTLADSLRLNRVTPYRATSMLHTPQHPAVHTLSKFSLRLISREWRNEGLCIRGHA